MIEPGQQIDVVRTLQSLSGPVGDGRLLFTMLLDDSRSISNNHQRVIGGHNECLSVLRRAPGKIVAQTQFLNGRVAEDYPPVADVAPLTTKTYPLSPGTPLFARTVETLQMVLTIAEKHPEDVTMTFVFTDGWDTSSHCLGVRATDVKKLVEPMFASGRHIVGAFAVYDGHTDFRRVFAEMGIPPQWIKILRDWHDVGAAMTDVGQSVSQASRSRKDFTETTNNGF